ncbi:MAG: sn-glycerol-1-phosphate dehydrogenase [Nitrosopumilus sp.]|nr:sn-glycerol-1-phosphate dehydrogenase [Nitrosopumilus sp.]MDA7941152.1 sn-glycerol-1-phosphate dehydrogenase [Nitrosopumilus sp.]MDA7942450.1 sn-glycerol-1-phosphate dehydrogenase [Nitrosopumilus sp.]MDA7945830.1 sn-glycerol-1-phosphate dehydrogenase [Nitrosopumilus sp.]MDA7953533.1 sn-glycerol-1-phosphate dehydrogenase [Nitrosopumilus sp.]
MELPRLIEIGEGNLAGFGRFVRRLGCGGRISLVSGPGARGRLGRRIEASLGALGIRARWHEAGENRPGPLRRLAGEVGRFRPSMVAGVGGGRPVDAAKLASHRLGIPFVSLPTAASHDGIASPFASVAGRRPHSMVATAPTGVFVDIRVIRGAPARLIASGCGDLVANMVAVRDWQLGHARGEYYGRYAADLAAMSARIIMENSRRFAGEGTDARVVVEALISAGVASCIAGSSRPCSGSEHLFSHALDRIAPGAGLHGEKCGIGSIMMSRLQGGDWRRVRRALRDVGAPTSAEQVGVSAADVVEAVVTAQSLRPGRHTILAEKRPGRRAAERLARETGVI